MIQEVTWWLFEAWVLLPGPVLIGLLSLPLPRVARRRVLSLFEKVKQPCAPLCKQRPLCGHFHHLGSPIILG